MAYKNFAIEEATSSDLNTYLMPQMVIICTSGTRPGSPSSGMRIWQTDTNTGFVYISGVWTQIESLGTPEAFVMKNANDTSGGSSFVNDPDLLLSVAASSVYLVKVSLVVKDASISVGFGVPTGAVMVWTPHAPHPTFISDPNLARISVNFFDETGQATVGVNTSTLNAMFIRGILVTGGSSGTLNFKRNRTTATLLKGCNLRLIKVA